MEGIDPICHISRLTKEQQDTFAAMPREYRRSLERHIEEAPEDKIATRRLFDAWAKRVAALKNIYRIEEVTVDMIAEANETYYTSRGLAYSR